MQKSEKKVTKKSKSGSVLGKAILAIGLILFVMIIGVGCGFLTASLNTRPNLAEDIVPPASSQIYDIHGNEIANIHAAENRRPVGINEIPKNLQNAFIAVEDNRFYEHIGIDPRGIVRAVWANIRGRTVTRRLCQRHGQDDLRGRLNDHATARKKCLPDAGSDVQAQSTGSISCAPARTSVYKARNP